MSRTPPRIPQAGFTLLSALALGLALFGLVGALLTGLRSHFIAVGEKQERERWEARQAEAEKQAQATFNENLHLGNLAAARQLTAAQEAHRYADHLALERRHATLIVPAAHCAATPDPTAAADPAPAVSPGLSADAVRLWNSALAGHDVPAGACGADAGATAACAADSGATVADAWENQATNALSCRIDRERLTNLQDYLRKAQANTPHRD